MAEFKISQLPAADAFTDSNLIEVVQTISNRKGTFAQLKTWIQTWLTKAMVGLGNVDNTPDSSKPVSSAMQAALDLKAAASSLASYYTITNANNTFVAVSQKGAANGVVPLGSDSKIAATYLPSYVDDVLEYAAVGNFPATGETGKMYVATNTNKVYRWSGSTYVEISGSPGSTDAVPEGAANLYFTNARAVAALSATLANYYTSAQVNNTFMPRNGGTFTGAVAVPAGFLINASGGDWGGFISLAKAPNGSLTSPTILQYQNLLLFFENGGGGRGAYLDMGNLSSWSNNRIVTTTDLAGYATQGYVTSVVANAGYATQAYVNAAVGSAQGAFAVVNGNLSTGSFVKIDLGGNNAAMMGILAISGTNVSSTGLGSVYNTASLFSASLGSSNNLTINNTRQIPNGSTGTNGAMTLFFDPGGRYVYLENRRAFTMAYSIPIMRV